MSFFKKLNHADKFIPVKVDLTGYYRETSQHIHMHTKSTQYVQKKKKKVEVCDTVVEQIR